MMESGELFEAFTREPSSIVFTIIMEQRLHLETVAFLSFNQWGIKIKLLFEENDNF